MNNPAEVSDEWILQIQLLPYYQQSIYRNLDIKKTIDFFTRRYVHPIAKKFDIASSAVVDCGAGFGWFSFAYLLAGGKSVIAVDMDSQRLATAEQISIILSLRDRMKFIASPMQKVPLSPDSVDIFVSIETLEHIGKKNIRTALQFIKNSTRRGILITTPNKFFPIIAHDTRLPFLHWLPPKYRKRIAAIMHRTAMDEGNEFLSPLDFNCLLDKFRPASCCLATENFSEYNALYPLYLPYGSDEQKRFQSHLNKSKALYYRSICAILKQYSYWLMPSLAILFERR